MDSFQNKLLIRLSKLKINKIVLGSIIITNINEYFENKYKITGYFKNNTIFINNSPNIDSLQIFINKNTILEIINKKIKGYGFKEIMKNIIIK